MIHTRHLPENNQQLFLGIIALAISVCFIGIITGITLKLNRDMAQQDANRIARTTTDQLSALIQRSVSNNEIEQTDFSTLYDNDAIDSIFVATVSRTSPNAPAIKQEIVNYQAQTGLKLFSGLWETVKLTESIPLLLPGEETVASLTLSVKTPVHFPWLSLGVALVTIAGLIAGLYVYWASTTQRISQPTRPKNQRTESSRDTKQATPVEQLSPDLTAHLSENTQQIVQSELELAQQSALELNRFKSQLMANTSHELLTPLNSILGYAKLLLDNHKSNHGQEQPENNYADLREKLTLIVDNAEHINSLVNDLVVVATENRTRLPLHYSEIGVEAFIRSIADSLDHDIRNKHLALKLELKTVDNLSIWSDPVRLRQILYNLLVNAIRYTDQGGISISTETIQKSGVEELIIVVSDTGRGIPKEQQDLLLKAFVRSDDANEPSAKGPGLGLGLGLSIVSRLTELLGGHLTLDSELDQGSRFAIHLPVGRNLAPETLSKQKPAGTERSRSYEEHSQHKANKTRSLLVVDDNPSNAKLIEEQLKGTGCQTTTCLDGGQAIALAAQQNFDAILLDIRMQPMDGYQVFSELRKLERYTQTPVFACTAHASDSEHQDLLKFGFGRVVKKPVIREVLVDLLGLDGGSELVIDSAIMLESDTSSGFFCPSLALKKAGGNVDVAIEIFRLLIADLEEKLQAQRTRSLGSGETLLDQIHQINGAAALTGTGELRQKANELESLLKENSDIDRSVQVDHLFDYIEQLLQWVENTDLITLFTESRSD